MKDAWSIFSLPLALTVKPLTYAPIRIAVCGLIELSLVEHPTTPPRAPAPPMSLR